MSAGERCTAAAARLRRSALLLGVDGAEELRVDVGVLLAGIRIGLRHDLVGGADVDVGGDGFSRRLAGLV